MQRKDGGRKTEDRGRRIEDGRRGTGDECMSEKILSFRDLEVYKVAFSLQQEIFEISKGFPKEELYSLIRTRFGDLQGL